MSAQFQARVYRFGPFRFDPAERSLSRDGEPVLLMPKAIDTLAVLLERRGQVVEKAELMKLVWPDCVVEEIGLARNISLLRKALGENAESYIETVPRRGDRFTARVGGGKRGELDRAGPPAGVAVSGGCGRGRRTAAGGEPETDSAAGGRRGG